MRIRKKKWIKSLLFISLISSTMIIKTSWDVVFAGDINSNESRVLQVLQKSYEYKEKTYRVSNEYIAAVKEYLMREDVDLSADEADQVIAEGFSNVEVGIADGYLVEVKSEVEKKHGSDKNQSMDHVEKNDSNQIEESAKETEQSSPDTNGNKEATYEISGNKEKVDKNKETEHLSTSDQSQAMLEPERLTQKPIKNTGFSIKSSIIFGGVILLVFVTLLTVAYCESRFAYDDE